MRGTTPKVALMALAGALVLSLRVLVHGEPFNYRTLTIILMASLSAAGAALPLAAGLARWRVPLAPLFAALAFSMLFMGLMSALFVFEHVVVAQHYEFFEGRTVRSHIMNLFRTAGLFLASSPTYLLPWVLPLLMVVAGLVLPSKTPRDS